MKDCTSFESASKAEKIGSESLAPSPAPFALADADEADDDEEEDDEVEELLVGAEDIFFSSVECSDGEKGITYMEVD